MKQFLRSLWTLLLLMMWCSVGFAQTTIWSEDWTGQKSDTNPSKVSSMYTQNNSKTRTYGGTSAEGKTPELLLQENDTWSVTISDLKGCNNSFTLSFKTNRHTTSKYISVTANGKTISCPREGKTSTHSGTFELNVATGKNLVLTFKANGDNCRIDDIKLTGTPVESKPTLTFSETEKTVYKGSESTFTMPTLVLKDKDGKEVTSGVDYLYEVTDANPEGCLGVDMITGKITFNKLGTANIKVTTRTKGSGSEFNNLTASFKLTYMKDPAAKDKLFFAEAEKTIYVGKTDGFEGLSATQLNMSGAEVTPELIIYEANPADVVDIDLETGKIKSWLKTGTTTITATSTYDNEEYTASYILNYKKIETTLTLSKTSVSVNLGETPELPTCTLKAGDEIITNKALSYTITPEGIANINATTGELTLISAGKATVNVSFIGDETYEASNIATYELTVVDPNATEVTFDFSKPDAYGHEVPGSGSATNLEEGEKIVSGVITITNIKNGVTNSNTNKARFHNKGGDITFRVYANGTISLSAQTGYTITRFAFEATEGGNLTTSSGTYSSQTRTWEGNAKSLSLTFNAKTFFQKLTVTYSKVATTTPLTLEEDADDTDAKIEANNGKTIDVKLTRSLKAGLWNTICLPFDVTAEQVESVLKATGNVKEFDKEDKATATIFFKPATEMKAGVPYLIKPTEDATVLNFKDVTINNVEEIDRINGNDYCICGVFGKYTMKTNGTELFLNAAGKFVAPAAATNTMKGFRAYFMVPSGASAAAININIDGETTGINNIETNAAVNGKVYNLNGQYVGNSLNGLKKGIYVVNGKKVIK